MGRPPGSKNKTKSDKPAKAKKPAKTKAPKAVKAKPPKAAEGETTSYKIPNKGQTQQLAKRIEAMATQSKDLAVVKKDVLNKAVETQHFNKYALGLALGLRRRAIKDPAKFALEFAHFLSYVEDLGLDQIADESKGLDLNGEDGQVDLEEAIAASPERPALTIVPTAEEKIEITGEEAA